MSKQIKIVCKVRTERLKECDLVVIADVESEKDGENEEDEIAEKRSLHEME